MNLLTLARDLRRRKARERQGLFVCEGIRVVEELARSALTARGVLVTETGLADARAAAAVAQLRARGADVMQVADRDFDSAAETDSPQGVLAVAEVPARSIAALPTPLITRLLVLDAVQDPGNAGTLIRTAAALETGATLAMPGTVDLWNAKVVRSAMGAHFHHPALSCTWEELDAFRRQHGVALWAADGAGEPVGRTPAPPRMALVVGNEGAGITAATRHRADHLVALPIAPAVESLNVAVAAGILLHALRR